MRIVIPGTLPSLNEIIEESKRHYGQYSSMKSVYTDMVRIIAKKEKLPHVDCAHFTFTWYVKNKRKNKDNIMAGQKFIFDGLQKAGVIDNDGWSQLGDITHRFEVDKQNPRIEIEIKEIC